MERTIEVLAVKGIGPNDESAIRLEWAQREIEELIGPCLNEVELETAAFNLISEDTREEVQTHLAFCACCREAVERRERLLELIVHASENGVDPEFDAFVEEQFADLRDFDDLDEL